jgi:acetyl esterase/lipase
MDRIQPRLDVVYKTVDLLQGKQQLKADVYIPAGAKAGERFPAVILISGGGLGTGGAQGDYDWRRAGAYQSYGRLLAASGLVGITFTKRYARGSRGTSEGEADTLDLVRYLREHNAEMQVDPDRMAVWVFSAGGWMLAPFLRDRPVYVRAAVAFYAVLDVPDDNMIPANEREALIKYSSRAQLPIQLNGCCAPAVFVAKASLDSPGLNASMDRFVQEAKKENNYVDLEYMEHAEGRHGFDIIDDNDRTREIIRAAVAFLQKQLGVHTAQK